MSGAKKAPIDTTAADALHAAGKQDYSWMMGNFGDVFDDINYDVKQSDIDALAGPAPDRAAIEADVRGERGTPQVAGIRGLGGALADKNTAAEVERRFSEQQQAYEKRRSEAGQQLIKEREEAKFGQTVEKNTGLAVSSITGAQRASTRAQRRLGLAPARGSLDDAQRSARAYELASAKAGAANTTRAGLRDLSIQRAQLAAGIGAGIKQMGQQSLGTAADMADQRNKYNATQTKGGVARALGTALTAGLGAATMGLAMPFVVGAGLVGAQQGYN